MADQTRNLSKQTPLPQLKILSPEYRAWIGLELGKIAIQMREEISKECLSLMVSTLVEIEPNQLRRALELAPLELKFFPRPAEIYEIVKREASIAEAAAQTFSPEDIDWLNKVGHWDWVGSKLRGLANAMNERVTQDTIGEMTKALIGIDPLRLHQAIWRVRRECKSFPAPAQIIERLPAEILSGPRRGPIALQPTSPTLHIPERTGGSRESTGPQSPDEQIAEIEKVKIGAVIKQRR
jgi:hypothetical protein